MDSELELCLDYMGDEEEAADGCYEVHKHESLLSEAGWRGCVEMADPTDWLSDEELGAAPASEACQAELGRRHGHHRRHRRHRRHHRRRLTRLPI